MTANFDLIFSQLGAQFIHQTSHALYRFAKRNDLVVDEDDLTRFEEEYYLKDGSEVSDTEVDLAWELIESQLEDIMDRENGRVSVGHQLLRRINDERSLSNGTKFVWEFYYKDISSDFGDDMTKMHIDQDLEYADLSGGDYNAPKLGFKALLDKLIERIPTTRFQLNAVVDRLHWDINCGNGNRFNDKTAVHLTDGRLIVADYVLVTLPLGVLKSGSVQFVPPLATSTSVAAIEKSV